MKTKYMIVYVYIIFESQAAVIFFPAYRTLVWGRQTAYRVTYRDTPRFTDTVAIGRWSAALRSNLICAATWENVIHVPIPKRKMHHTFKERSIVSYLMYAKPSYISTLMDNMKLGNPSYNLLFHCQYQNVPWLKPERRNNKK